MQHPMIATQPIPGRETQIVPPLPATGPPPGWVRNSPTWGPRLQQAMADRVPYQVDSNTQGSYAYEPPMGPPEPPVYRPPMPPQQEPMGPPAPPPAAVQYDQQLTPEQAQMLEQELAYNMLREPQAMQAPMIAMAPQQGRETQVVPPTMRVNPPQMPPPLTDEELLAYNMQRGSPAEDLLGPIPK